MFEQIEFICNDKLIRRLVNPAVTLLDFLRRELRLTGTKEGCREGDCGACTVLLGELVNEGMTYQTVNSCLLPLAAVTGKHVITIEGLNGIELNPIQQCLVDEGGTQCGFCTPGFIISMTGYFLSNKTYKAEELINHLDGNICRCTGHASIKRAADKAVDYLTANNGKEITSLIIPEWFNEIPARLNGLKSNGALNLITNIPTPVSYEANTPVSTHIPVVGGGTDLYAQKWEELYNSGIEVYTADHGEKICIDGNIITINAGTTVTEIMSSELLNKYFPDIKEYFQLFGSTPIRNRATLGGNIVNASPIADITCFFLALNSKLHLSGKKKSRQVQLKDFFTGYKTLDKSPDELVTSLSFHIPAPVSLFSFEKVSKRTYLDIASVNSSLYIESKNNIIKEVHVSAGGVAPIPLYLGKTRGYLLTKEITPSVISEAAIIAQLETSPISDARGSAEYKKLLLRQLIFAHFLKLFPEIKMEELV